MENDPFGFDHSTTDQSRPRFSPDPALPTPPVLSGWSHHPYILVHDLVIAECRATELVGYPGCG